MKRKININKQSLTSSEINATKNFDALAKTFASGTGVVTSPKTPKYKGWFVGGIATLAVVTAIYFSVNTTNETLDYIQEETKAETSKVDSIEKVPFVNPLLASVDIPKKIYTLNADKGGKINHFTGTEITVPAGAFKDEEGNIIKGEVEIQYREFHDQADIFLSGIPMEYDSAGKKSIFESAGMMEIRGFQNGKRLKIVADKNFRICMHSKNSDPKFNLYSLDETKRKWDYEGKDSISNSVEELSSEDTNTSYYDFPEFEQELNQKEKNDPEIKEVKEEISIIKKEIKEIEKTEPAKPIKATKTKKNFTIDVVKGEYPELSVYSGTIFEVKDKEEMPKDVYTVTWNDINLKKENKGYSVELSEGKRKISIPVIPVLDGKNYKEALAKFDNKFGEYSQVLTKKKEEERVAIVKLEDLKNAYARQRKVYEKKMIAQQEAREAQMKGLVKLQRVYSINKFGTWNCDSPIKTPKGMLVKSFFIDKETEEVLDFSRMDLIEKNRNACFPLAAFGGSTVTFNPRRDNMIWAFTRDGKVAITEDGDFKNISKRDDSYTFKMKVVDIRGKKLSEIKKILNI